MIDNIRERKVEFRKIEFKGRVQKECKLEFYNYESVSGVLYTQTTWRIFEYTRVNYVIYVTIHDTYYVFDLSNANWPPESIKCFNVNNIEDLFKKIKSRFRYIDRQEITLKNVR